MQDELGGCSLHMDAHSVYYADSLGAHALDCVAGTLVRCGLVLRRTTECSGSLQSTICPHRAQTDSNRVPHDTHRLCCTHTTTLLYAAVR